MEKASVRKRSMTLFPVAEIHWKGALSKYGFTQPDTLEQTWTSFCQDRIKFSVDKQKNTIAATVNGERSCEINYRSSLRLQSLIQEGFTVKKTVFCRDDSLGVVALVGKAHLNNQAQKKRKHALVCIDVCEGEVIACLDIKTSDGREHVCHIEVWECDTSKDGRLLAMSVALMIDDNFIVDSCENFVCLYDRKYNRELRRVWNWDNVVCGLGFDPRFNHLQYALVGMRQSVTEKTSLSVYDVRKKKALLSVPINHEIDRDGETYFQVRFSKDGEFLILQVIENIAYAREWMYRTCIYRSHNLELLAVCQPNNAISCHVDCVPRQLPIISRCGSHMALGTFHGQPNRKRTLEVELYRLPLSLDLRHLARVAILRSLRSQDGVEKLPLPTALQQYLLWEPQDAIRLLPTDAQEPRPKSLSV